MLAPTTPLRAMRWCGYALGLGMLVLASMPPVAVAADNARFASWLALCDDNLDCEAHTAEIERGSAGSFSLSLSRDGDSWAMSVASSIRPDISLGIQLVVDETPVFFPSDSVVLRGSEAIAGAASAYHMYPQGAKAEQVLRLLRPGNRVNVDFADCGGTEHTLSFSLSGITAALSWIGQKQRRPVSGLGLGEAESGPGQAITTGCGG